MGIFYNNYNEGILFSSKKGKESVLDSAESAKKCLDFYLKTLEKAVSAFGKAINLVVVDPDKYNENKADRAVTDAESVFTDANKEYDDKIKNELGKFVQLSSKSFWNRADIKALAKEDPEFMEFVKSCRDGSRYVRMQKIITNFNKILYDADEKIKNTDFKKVSAQQRFCSSRLETVNQRIKDEIGGTTGDFHNLRKYMRAVKESSLLESFLDRVEFK